ncbi:MAG: hypothetical protein PHX20_01095 [Candidatus Omnitrophica bacterium]|nr:hypothetical protein [Candidatus Omnitrophota bacterium]
MSEIVFSKINQERHQSHDTRKILFPKIEKILKRPLVSFFTSFNYPVSLDDDDVDMLQGVLQRMDLSNGLAILINSPGGDGLAAERFINACRNFSKKSEYWVIVAGKAKSAATMASFGASQIWMSPTSELGPIDPQIIRKEDGKLKRFSAYNYLKSYKKLFAAASKTKGRIEPYLQQLGRYDEREMEEIRSAIELSNDIAVRALSTGMMNNTKKRNIEKKIKVFLDPQVGTKDHGRAIYRDEARKCGLNITDLDFNSDLWKLLYELCIRTDVFVSTNASKCVESAKDNFAAPPMVKRNEDEDNKS